MPPRSLVWGLRNRLTPRQRSALRTATDEALAFVGSVKGARTAERVVALTYDDGPDPAGTAAVLDALAAHGATATFFQLVHRAERHPDLVRRVLEEGHEIALHGLDHSRLTALPVDVVRRTLGEARRRLEDVAGAPVRWFRPPYGAQTLATYRAATRAGLTPVVWGPTVADWQDGTPADVAARPAARPRPGQVVLLHDAFEAPAGDPTPAPTFDRGEVTHAYLERLAREGYRGTSVSGLLTLGRTWRTAWFRP